MIADNLYCRTSLEKTKPQASSIFLTDSTGKEKQSPAPFFDEWIFPSSLSRQRRKKPRNVFFAPCSPAVFSLFFSVFPCFIPFTRERERERERWSPALLFSFFSWCALSREGGHCLSARECFSRDFSFCSTFTADGTRANKTHGPT